MLNTREFEFEGSKYSYELDGYKPLGVQDEDGKDVEEQRVYEAACLDAVEYLQSKREFELEQMQEESSSGASHDPSEDNK